MKSIKLLITILFLFFSISILKAQPGGPPDPPDSHGESGDQNPGGNAALGGGFLILMILGTAYCGAKVLMDNNVFVRRSD